MPFRKVCLLTIDYSQLQISMLKQLTQAFKTVFTIICAFFCINTAIAQNDSTKTTLDSNVVIPKSGKAPAYRWQDHYLNRFSDRLLQTPLVLPDPKNVKTIFSLDPTTKNISVLEKIGPSIDYKLPQSMNFNQYSSIQNRIVKQNLIRDYEESQDGKSAISGRGLRPLLEKNPVVDRIFGGNLVDFKPNGFVTLDFQLVNQFIDNPFIPLALRRQTNFNFNEQININFNGKIGEKMGLLTNLDTKAAFNFENQLKLNFKNQPEDILQRVEAGNVSMPVRSQLIPGVQNLFGFKAGLKLGKLDITGVVAQQRSRTQSIVLNGGSQNKPFEVRCDNYDENRHFFLSQFFRDNYERWLKNLPVITSGVRITRLEVYVTNRNNNIESMRSLAAFRDLGEGQPVTTGLSGKGKNAATDNRANTLYLKLYNSQSFRNADTNSTQFLQTLGLKKGTDYEFLRGARRLTEREYRFQPELGYVSLVTPLRNDEILAVSYEYVYQGQNYKVGELTEDYSALAENQVIALKLLKSATIRNRTSLDPTKIDPLWNLMMKNVYSLGTSSLTRQGFTLRVIYKDDRTGVDNPNLQDGEAVPAYDKEKRKLKDIPLLELFGLDRLNPNNDPQKDGNFDFVEDVTVDSKLGKIIFPVLEPFGKTLEEKLEGQDILLRDKYVFNELYRTTLADAQQVTTKNKFFIRGQFTSGGNAEVQLPLGASGSGVRVYAGGQQLQEGIDYTIEPQLGRVRITNQSILNSSRQIRVDYELPDLFQTQIRGLFGLRLDYDVSPYLHLGFTGMMMREAPAGFLTRTAIGNEPVNNTILGGDINFKRESRFLTKLLDKLPLIQTKEISAIQFTGEYARLFPKINEKRISNNSAMIDDFEAARNINDLTRQANRWRLGSTPQGEGKNFGGERSNFAYNFKRAKISVYTVDQSTYLTGGFGVGNAGIPQELLDDINSNIYERPFVPQDIFAGRSQPVAGQLLPLSVLDISYFPSERGMYNYTTDVLFDGKLKNARENFGAIMRGITADNDFENANTEYLTFWLLDPFREQIRDGKPGEYKANTKGGKVLIHLGDISEDVIPDTYNNFENGLIPTGTSANSKPVITQWGRAPQVQFMTDAFDNQQNARTQQDVGLDGMADSLERSFHRNFLSSIRSKVTSDVYQELENDPSGDNFKFFLDSTYNASSAKLITRFKGYLGMEGNSPPSDQANQLTPSNTVLPDKEDINADNTVNDVEAYHEYELDIRPENLAVGQGFIVDKVITPNSDNVAWYLFRVPVRKPTRSVNGINGFKSIRFMRMVMTDFEEPVVMRFAAMQLESNSYRQYDKEINDPTKPLIAGDTELKVGVVNVEENGCDLETGNCNIKDGNIPYLVPPDFQRDRDITQQNFFQFNEQSLSLNVRNLRDGDARAVFKNTRLDLLFYKNLRMFIHAQNTQNRSDVAGAFIRFGTDNSQNYYEIEIPKLAVTERKGTNGATYSENEVWQNSIDMPLDSMRNLKSLRNRAGVALNQRYTRTITVADYRGVNRTYNITVVGNPDLSTILTVMLGVTNPKDDGLAQSFVVWMNELRASDFDQTAGDAGIMSADIKLADLATVSLNGNFKNFGFGGVQDKISERSRDNTNGFGIAANVKLDKFFPENWGLQIPFFINFDKQIINPEFNPLDPDMKLSQSLSDIADGRRRDDLRRFVVDESTRRGFNFSNVRKIKTKQDAKSHFYDIENFSFTYAQSNISRTNVLTEEFSNNQYRGGLTYQYQPQNTKPWEPFKNAKGLANPKLGWLKDFNLSPIPTVMAFRTDFDRSYMKTQLRNTDENGELTSKGVLPFYEKYFWMNRAYDLQWNLTKSVLVNYNAENRAIIDEPYGETSRDSIWANIRRLGRAKNFDQRLTTTYRLPLDRFFILDWMQADAKYNTQFNFQAASYDIRDENDQLFGNLIRNGREYGLQGRIDLVKLYNKFKYLRSANAPKTQQKRFTRSPADDEEIEIPKSDVTKTVTRLLMAVRGINFDYSMVETTVLPGFLGTPQFFGTRGNAPGYGFSLLGSQYTNPAKVDEFLRRMENQDLLSKSLVMNNPFTQTRQKRFSYSTNLEPFKDFRIFIRGQLTRGDGYSFFYRDTLGNYGYRSPVRNGNFNMSFWSFKTFFARMDEKNNYQYELFDNMVAYREVVQKLLNDRRENREGSYLLNSQDVLIPAFFAAYSGKDVNKVTERMLGLQNGRKNGSSKSPFFLPLPNWRIDYNGLSNVKAFAKYFSSITINHSYNSTINVGNFTSSLDYGAQYINLAMMGYQFGSLIDRTIQLDNPAAPLSFMPVFVMSTITLEEKFMPFMGVNFTTKSKISGKLEYNRERRAGLNLANSQVAEYNSDDFVFGFGFRKNNVKLPFRGRDGNFIILKNDVNFRFDWTIRNVRALQRRLDGDPQPVQGNRNVQIRPSIQYQLNKRVAMNFYIEHLVNDPFVSTSFYRKSTTGGLNVRFSLAD